LRWQSCCTTSCGFSSMRGMNPVRHILKGWWDKRSWSDYYMLLNADISVGSHP
jgi:hypothetical protein